MTHHPSTRESREAMQLQVTRIEQRSALVKSFTLQTTDGLALPKFEPGAHVRVTIPSLNEADPSRAYSLVSDPADLTHYEIAVLLVEDGNGGSRYLHHEVRVGDLLEVTPPRNEFPYIQSTPHSILIAGGIGITPILSLCRDLASAGGSFEVHYVGRGEQHMPYRRDLREISGGRAHIYSSRNEFDLAGILTRRQPETHLYACGPHSLLEATRMLARSAGILRSNIHFESFGYRRMPADRPVQLELCKSGLVVDVVPGRPLLEIIEGLGIWAPAECRRGECGMCITTIREGLGDHRDHCLTQEERAVSICICVSWSATERLALDI